MIRLKPGLWVTLGVMTLTAGLLSGCAHQEGQSPYTGTPSSTTATNGAGTTASPNVIQADPAWFSCEKDSDCKLEQGVCNELQAVNSNFLTPFHQYRDQMNQSVNCVAHQSVGMLPQPPMCVAHRCTVKAAKHRGPDYVHHRGKRH